MYLRRSVFPRASFTQATSDVDERESPKWHKGERTIQCGPCICWCNPGVRLRESQATILIHDNNHPTRNFFSGERRCTGILQNAVNVRTRNIYTASSCKHLNSIFNIIITASLSSSKWVDAFPNYTWRGPENRSQLHAAKRTPEGLFPGV